MTHHAIRPRLRRGITTGFAVASAALLLASTAPASAAEDLTTDDYRAPSAPLTGGNAAYEYAPAVINEGGLYRMWYCAQDPAGAVPGDDILYAESTSQDGPFTGPGGGDPMIVFEGTGGGGFDGQHTCDPSIVKVDGTYYMYYGAAVNDGETTIGVARSADGISWERIHDGPIIVPAHQVDRGNDYGAGQPSAVYRDGLFYLIFTDTTGAGTEPNGAGQFAWRSSTPTFDDTEVFTADGWQPYTPENSRSFSVANAFSADWQYSDELESFVVAHNNEPGSTILTFLDGENLAEWSYNEVRIDGAFVEGPGIVSTPDKHALDDPWDECGRVPMDVMHASSGPPDAPPQDLVHKGIAVIASMDCTPEPTETPTPTETSTETPTATPTETPTPTPTEAPTETDTPSESPSPSDSPSPTETTPPDDDDLPDTGVGAGPLAGVGFGLLAAAAGAIYLNRKANQTA